MAAKFDLTEEKSYESLTLYPTSGGQNLFRHLQAITAKGKSTPNAGAAQTSLVLEKLRTAPQHSDLDLSRDDMARLTLWMDVYAQKLGHFSDEQEQEIIDLRDRYRDLIVEKETDSTRELSMR